MTSEQFEVEVAYAKADEQAIIKVTAEQGLTVLQAVERSRITDRFPEIDLENAKFGIFGKAAKAEAELNPGDRIEIYRPLIADPKQARKKRAEEGKALKKGT
ncbi:MAG: RnfH family protein [Sedimenticola sp.]|nr:RnfH family protein [Sedimenticola sp.]MCW8919939.1 RnfH family protein [Sedimenticola sp.]MCW8947126.1 RnfH family protein [Sedimenticola sp.]MCW8948637.1 RnfH family protein [Sedimenticola sp.]MCW8975395.1 RnfH family protein [Sedimenticola sp.]